MDSNVTSAIISGICSIVSAFGAIYLKEYYNGYRMHSSLNTIPDGMGRENTAKIVDINKYRWKKHCRGLFQTPIAA